MTPHIPSPADLATRPHRPLSARPVQHSHAPAEDAPWRARWDYAVKYSRLHPNTRLVALTIATYADPDTGAFRPGDSPGSPRLAAATGLFEGTVRRALQELTRNGFMTRTPATDGRDVQLHLHIPTTTARGR